MTKAIKSINEEFYRIDYICSMTGLLHLKLLLLLALLLSAGLIHAQDGAGRHPCEQLKKGKIAPPIRMAYKMPSFPGGEIKMKKYIGDNFRHPDKKAQKHGTIYIAAVINPDGTLSNERLLKGINGAYNREAMRVVRSMPKWMPGECEAGKKVAVEVLIKINTF